ncbi:MAG: hypothetical protein ACI9P5_004879 [Saprospiraceae bacterium]|jgi:hypothetical protein
MVVLKTSFTKGLNINFINQKARLEIDRNITTMLQVVFSLTLRGFYVIKCRIYRQSFCLPTRQKIVTSKYDIIFNYHS